MRGIIDRLLTSEEPSVRFKVRVQVLGEDPASPAVRRLQGQIRRSPRVAALLSERVADGKIPYHPYAKWYGAHWVLATLADIGYPAGDKSLVPLGEQVYSWLLSPQHLTEAVREIDGRVRRCGSQEGNALWAMLTLGIADERADTLAANLMRWQWPDGGWNCDKRPEAAKSSFHETLIPLRALALYGKVRREKAALEAARRASEVFLKRRLFRRLSDGGVMNDDFLLLCYPAYWHYGVLAGLKVVAETGFICDARCREALDFIESKRLPDGGFPAEARYYKGTPKQTMTAGRSLVDWGEVSKRKTNEFVTADALYVLKAAGRLRNDER